MPLDGYMKPDRPPSAGQTDFTITTDQPNRHQHQYRQSQYQQQRQLNKRIMMNPPEAFIQAAFAAQPTPPFSNGLVFDHGGQAVLVPLAASESTSNNPETDTQEVSTNEPDNGEPLIVGPAPALASGPGATQQQVLSAQSPTLTQTEQNTTPTPTPTATQMQVTATPTQSQSQESILEIVNSQVTSASSDLSVTDSSITTTPTSLDPSSTMSDLISTKAPSSTSGTSTISSIPSSSSSSSAASAAASSEPPKPFTQSTPFIFLMVLGALVLVAAIATMFSTFMRWQRTCGCLPCCRPERDEDDDEDGLSDLVQSFDHDRMSRASSMRAPSEMGLTNSQHASLERRSSLFATAPQQSPYLHSANNVDGSVFGSTMGKMYAGGPLQVKNAVEGDIPTETDSIHASIGPRHLGVEGNGLSVPWQTTHPTIRSYTASSFASSRYGGPPFPSPPVTIDEAEQQQPTRASTWASNLRSTLFTAISANAMRSRQSSHDDSDRYTRPVLPLHRGSTRRSTRSDISSRSAMPTRSYPLVIDEKDEQELDAAQAQAQGMGRDRFMMSRVPESHTSAESSMTIGDRYKNWSRSQRSDVWVKPVMAGGERARGAGAGLGAGSGIYHNA